MQIFNAFSNVATVNLSVLKLRQLFQFLHAAVNVGAFDRRGARQAEAFAAK